MKTLLIVEMDNCGCDAKPYGGCPYLDDAGPQLSGYKCTLDNHEDTIIHDLFRKCPLPKIEPEL